MQVEFKKMNPVAKELWLAALRSGKYTQGTGSLLKDGKYCCLGVLCEVAIESGEEVKRDTCQVEECYCGSGAFDGYTSFHPVSVGEWADLHPNDSEANTLAGMNDGGKPFTEIADWIEENL